MKFEVAYVRLFSPVLFLIVLRDVLLEALKLHQASGIRWTMTSFLQHLDSADDICLFAHKVAELSAMVKSLEVVTLSLTRNANGLVQVGGEQIDAVDKFTHLGSEIDVNGGTDLDIESPIKKSISAFGILSPVGRNVNMINMIKKALEELGHSIKNVTNIFNKTKVPQPMFRVELEPNTRKFKKSETHPIY